MASSFRLSRGGGRRYLASVALAAVTAVALVIPAPVLGVQRIFEHQHSTNTDERVGRVQPSAAQKAIVRDLGATVRWNRFGTPSSLIRYGGYLGRRVEGQTAAAAARAWVTQHRGLFKFESVTTANLETLNVSPMGSNGHAVLFRQRFGGLSSGADGMIAVGITGSAAAGWKVAYVSSTAVGTAAAPAPATLTARDAWMRAATDLGRVVALADVKKSWREHSWTVFAVAGFTQTQRARLVAVPIPGKGVRAAYEANVVDYGGTKTLGYTSFVDARSGKVLMRHNRVQYAASQAVPTAQVATAQPSTQFFTGATTATECGPDHDFTVPAGMTSITVHASYLLVSNDIVIRIIRDPDGTRTIVAGADNSLSPEVARYAPPTGVPPGPYAVQLCPLPQSINPEQMPPWNYAGQVIVSDEPVSGFPYPPMWKYFELNPRIDFNDDDIRVVRCWEKRISGNDVPGCTAGRSALRNLASRAPWDVLDQNTGTSTFTTIGNNANTAEAWYNPPTVLFGTITPGALNQRAVDPNRRYIFPWTNAWYNSKCNQANTVPGGNDVFASVAQLFATHNRMHDFSYWLGFTETTSNLQHSNYGLTGPERQNDPEVGNVQSGGATGGPPDYGGRDNANQLTLQDGVPGMTNQYLFQPIGSVIYVPCVDGDYDMSIVGHEYTHAISNRMVAGPDAGLLSDEGGAMGESWSDLVATEFLFEHDLFLPGQNPYAIGPYATGDNDQGIRNFPLNNNPLNYSNLGFDVMGFEVHSDGEIWNAVNWDIRNFLAAKYNASFPASNASLQRRCAEQTINPTTGNPEGPLPPNRCPGNRRWIQIMFDAFVLMQSDVDMLAARDAYLAVDQIRFGGANQRELWRAFARRGMGAGAVADTDIDPGPGLDAGDYSPTPSFRSPMESNGLVTFRVIAPDENGANVPARIMVGRFEARTSPVADTIPADDDDNTPELSNSVRLVPGTYMFTVQADGYGSMRFTRTIGTGQYAIRVSMPTNWASRHKGATSPAGNGTNRNDLIDDTEGTSWVSNNNEPTAVGSSAIVDLAGTAPRLVDRVRVSAVNLEVFAQNRFENVRQFAIETCLATTAVTCALPAQFQRIYESPPHAFPGSAIWPWIKDLTLREFNVPNTMATHVRFVVLQNQCTGNPLFHEAFEDNDLRDSVDCRVGALITLGGGDEWARAAELQVISGQGTATEPVDPVVLTSLAAPATAAAGSDISYTASYTNAGPGAASQARVTAVLPSQVSFRSAGGGSSRSYDPATRTVRWDLGSVPAGTSGSVRLTVRVGANVPTGTAIVQTASFTADQTVSNPAAAATIVE